MLEFNGTEIRKRIAATYTNAMERPSEKGFLRVTNANLETLDQEYDHKNGECFWSGCEERYITFYQPGEYHLEYNVTVRNTPYIGVKKVLVVDVRGMYDNLYANLY